MTAIYVRLADEVYERLNNLALKTGRSKTYYVSRAVNEKLEEMEDVFLAEKEIEDIRSGKSTVTPLAEVMKRYGL